MMERGLVICLALAMFVATSGAIAHKGTGFPGKGSPIAWNKAAKIFNQGNDARKQGNLDEAIRLYESAIREYPFDADFYLAQSLMYAKFKRDPKKAEGYVFRAVNLEPTVFKYRWQYAVLLMEQDRMDEARSEFSKAKQSKKTLAEEERLTEMLKEIGEVNSGSKR